MPITTAGERLTEAHRVAQIRNAAGAVAAVRAQHRQFVVPDQSRTYAPFVEQSFPAVLAARQRSRALAGRYYRQIGLLESGDRMHRELAVEETDEHFEERVKASLMIVGRNRHMKRLRGGDPPQRAERKTLRGIDGAVIRHTMNGGRDEIIRNVKADRKATGFVRVTANDSEVCWFCAMLAGRTDYKQGSFNRSDARFKLGGNPLANAKVHDNCRCAIRPTFDNEIPPRTEEYQRLWRELSGGDDDPATNFRRNWEARRG